MSVGGVAVGELVYLDSSALMRWAAATGGSPHDRDERGRKKLESLLGGSDELGASPITIAEFTSVLHDFVRTDKDWGSFFEAGDADTCMRQVMEWLAEGAVTIRPLGRRAFEMGMAYVSMVAAQGQRMRGWDAIHLFEATRWARDAERRVTLATSDTDFKKTIELFPEFGQRIDVLDVTA